MVCTRLPLFVRAKYALRKLPGSRLSYANCPGAYLALGLKVPMFLLLRWAPKVICIFGHWFCVCYLPSRLLPMGPELYIARFDALLIRARWRRALL